MAQINITNTHVILTLSVPDNKYLGLGFNVMSIITGKDILEIGLPNAGSLTICVFN